MLAPCSHQAMECGARKFRISAIVRPDVFPRHHGAGPGPVGLNPESTKNQRPGGSPDAGSGPARFAADRLESHTPGLKPAGRLRQSRRHHQQRRALS